MQNLHTEAKLTKRISKTHWYETKIVQFLFAIIGIVIFFGLVLAIVSLVFGGLLFLNSLRVEGGIVGFIAGFGMLLIIAWIFRR